MRVKIVAGVVLAAVVALVVVLLHPWRDDSALPADAAFRIGDRVVTVAQLNARDKALTALYGVEKPAKGTALDTFNRQAAKSMAMNIVLDNAIAEHHIKVSDAEVQQAQKALIAAEFNGSQTTFAQNLSQAGVTEATVLAEIRRQLALRVLLTQIAGKVTATDAEAAAAFPANKANLGTPEKRVVYNIVVADRAAADQVRKALEGGASVTAVAKQVSIDGATREQGGLLGTVTQAQLLAGVGAAAFSVKAGGVYGPVQGSQGWNVGAVTKVIPGVPPTLAAALPALRTIVIDQKKEAAWTRWLTAQLRAAKVDYAASYLPKDPYKVAAWNATPTTSANGS
ncbi:MAG: foldase protein PrsA [Marmoricola sp.]